MNVSVFSGPVQKERIFPLIETGEYIATLNDLTFESGGTYGDSLLWKWLLALPADPTGYLCRDDGMEKTFHEYTSPDVVMGSKAHEWIAALTGQVLEDGDEPPDAEDLIGKRMVVYITHQAPQQGPNKGKLRERFVAGSAKRWAGLPKTVARSTPSKPAPKEDEQNREKLIEEAGRWIGKAVKLLTPSHPDWVAVDLNDAADDALHMLIRDAKAEVQAALDA